MKQKQQRAESGRMFIDIRGAAHSPILLTPWVCKENGERKMRIELGNEEPNVMLWS